MINKIRALFNPERYHGWGKSKRYFEGWYYKIVTASEDNAFAIIPGIAMDENGAQQAFIQILNGNNLSATYHKYEATEFLARSESFKVNIASNYFSINRIELNLPDVIGELSFDNQVLWPNDWYSPGIMGPFSFVPFMQCYHGILSMDHIIRGNLEIGGQSIDFEGGRGYIEKDWGRSFPSGYIWMQSNHFSKPGISIKASIAKIPWLTSSFIGFIAGVNIHGRLIEFTTYNFTKLRKSYADKEKVELIMENTRYNLEIFVKREAATELASPILGFMDGRIEESMTALIHVKLVDKKNNIVLLDDIGRNGGLEVAGNIEDVMV